jgi:nucleoside-diphosphate-sugar epimerase
MESFVVGEINDATDWSHTLVDVNAVVHLAALVHVVHDNVADPLAAFRAVNVVGTLDLARQATAAMVKRFVFISSVKVNGEATLPSRPFTADDMPVPHDPYGVSKMEAEQGLRQIAAETFLSQPQAANQTFLVSDGHDLSNTELVRGMARAAGVPARLLPVPVWALQAGAALLGKGDAVQRLCGNLQVDMSKARSLLGWVPPVSVEEGLRRAMAV